MSRYVEFIHIFHWKWVWFVELYKEYSRTRRAVRLSDHSETSAPLAKNNQTCILERNTSRDYWISIELCPIIAPHRGQIPCQDGNKPGEVGSCQAKPGWFQLAETSCRWSRHHFKTQKEKKFWTPITNDHGLYFTWHWWVVAFAERPARPEQSVLQQGQTDLKVSNNKKVKNKRRWETKRRAEQSEGGQKIRNNFFIWVEATFVPKFAKLAEFSLQATSLPGFSFFLQTEQVISNVNLTILFLNNILVYEQKLFQRWKRNVAC